MGDEAARAFVAVIRAHNTSLAAAARDASARHAKALSEHTSAHRAATLAHAKEAAAGRPAHAPPSSALQRLKAKAADRWRAVEQAACDREVLQLAPGTAVSAGLAGEVSLALLYAQFRLLLEAMAGKRGGESVDMSKSGLGDGDAAAVAGVLKLSRHVTALDLSGNGAGRRGARRGAARRGPLSFFSLPLGSESRVACGLPFAPSPARASSDPLYPGTPSLPPPAPSPLGRRRGRPRL